MLLLISGSLRKDSLNTKLAKAAAKHYGGDSQLADLNLPLYDGDLEEASGIPASVQKLADQIASAEAVVIASPEYNQGISGVLKNALDWVSRTKGGPWKGKPVALIHATAGRAGGARANYALRLAMAPFGTKLLQGPEILIAGAHDEFNEDGSVKSDRYDEALAGAMDALKSL